MDGRIDEQRLVEPVGDQRGLVHRNAQCLDFGPVADGGATPGGIVLRPVCGGAFPPVGTVTAAGIKAVRGGPAEPVDIDRDPVRQLHEVLVTDQIVGVVGDDRHRCLGRGCPALHAGQVGGAQQAFEAELEERSGPFD